MRQMWGSSKVRKQHYERAQTEGPNGFENTHRGGKYVYFPITTSYLSPLFPDTLSLRYILFPSPPPRSCVYVFWEHSPDSSTDRCISSSLQSSVTKKLKDLNFRSFAAPWYAIQYPSFQWPYRIVLYSTTLHKHVGTHTHTHTHTTWTVTNPAE